MNAASSKRKSIEQKKKFEEKFSPKRLQEKGKELQLNKILGINQAKLVEKFIKHNANPQMIRNSRTL